MCECFFNNNVCLVVSDAEVYLSNRLNELSKLSSKVERVISECSELNIVHDDCKTLSLSVMKTGERLSVIQTLLELLVEDMNSIL